MGAIDDLIGRWVRTVEKTGELKRSKLFGRPLPADPGYEQTPEELRMAHKILKNAGYVPAEVAGLQRVSELRKALAATGDPAEQQQLRKEIAELQQRLALRLERKRR
jgi:hypothetical protein